MSRYVNVVLRRNQVGETYAIGELKVDGRPIGRTLEYPWRGNATWQDGQKKGWNFFHTSCVREGIYQGLLRSDHRNHGSVQWRVELEGTVGRVAIQFHSGNTLIKHSEGCILVGTSLVHAPGIEPKVVGSVDAMNKFVKAILGDVSTLKNPSDWAAMMMGIRITVRVIGMPAGAWKVV